MSLNVCVIKGRLGKDVHFITGDNTEHSYLKVATSKDYVSKNGEAKSRTRWVSVKAFGKQANSSQYFKKGDEVLVKGEISEETWKEGETYKTSQFLIADEVLLTRKFVKSERISAEDMPF